GTRAPARRRGSALAPGTGAGPPAIALGAAAHFPRRTVPPRARRRASPDAGPLAAKTPAALQSPRLRHGALPAGVGPRRFHPGCLAQEGRAPARAGAPPAGGAHRRPPGCGLSPAAPTLV